MDEVRIASLEGRGRRKRGEEGGAGINSKRALRAETGHRGEGEREGI